MTPSTLLALWALVTLGSCGVPAQRYDAELVALIVGGPGGLREETAPLLVGRGLPLQGGPAAVRVEVASLGWGGVRSTRVAGAGPAAVHLEWRWGSARGESWLVAGDVEAAGPGFLSFGGSPSASGESAVLADRDGRFVVERWRDGMLVTVDEAIPGQELALADLRLLLDVWLPASEARNVAGPTVGGRRAAELRVIAPEGERLVWVLVDDPLSHITLGNARVLARSSRADVVAEAP